MGYAMGAAATFTPFSGSIDQGIVVNQTMPSTGGQTTSYDANVINVTSPGYSVPFTGTLGPFGGVPHVSALTAYMTVSGPVPTHGDGNDNNALWGAIVETEPVGFIKGTNGTAYSNISAPNDAIYGSVGFTDVGPSGSVQYCVPVFAESTIATGGAAAYRLGVFSGSFGPNQAGTVDSAFAVGQIGSIPPPGREFYATSAPYVNAFTLFTGSSSFPPLPSNGNVFYADQAFTTGSFANLPNVTFSGNLFNFQNFAMSGDGHAIVGAGSASLPASTSNARFVVTAGSAGQVQSWASPNGTDLSNIDGLQIFDSSGNNALAPVVWEAGITTPRFGQARGNFAGVVTFGSSNLGLMVGTTTNKPLILGASDVAVVTIQAGVQVGSPTGGDKGAGTINVATNIYFNSTAYTNPDYALEHYFTGKIVRFAKNRGAAGYRGLTPLAELKALLAKSLRLPGITDEPAGAVERHDLALEKIEEVMLYVIELHDRLAALEARAAVPEPAI